MKLIASFALLVMLGLCTQIASGVKRPPQPDLQVVPASALPLETQNPAQDLLLYSSRFYNAWLYLEQEQGARILVLDVSDPSRIRLVANVSTGLGKPFDLVRVPRKRLAIARFRDGSGQKVLNLSRPRAPRLVAEPPDLPQLPVVSDTTGYPGVELRPVADAGVPTGDRALQIIEPGIKPQLIATIPHVTHQTFRPETGTVFLLGERGLVVVRQHKAEVDWELSFVDDESQN
jgi:hypothetical protein